MLLDQTLYSQLADTVKISLKKHQKSLASAFLAPTILIGYGISTMGDNGLFFSSYEVNEFIQRKYPDFQSDTDDWLRYIPAVSVYGLNFAGIKGKNNFIDRSLIYLISTSIARMSYLALKKETHILRPDESEYSSFPSGHTTLAFVSATFLYEEYKDVNIWYGIAGYSMAAATGMLRMLNEKHWMSDVFVGAGLGILTTKLTYIVYPEIKKIVEGKIFHKRIKNLAISPYYFDNNFGISLCLTIN